MMVSVSILHSKPIIFRILTTDTGSKRKAEDDPTSPSVSKRAKHEDSSESQDDEPSVMKRIPFPEKV